MGKRFAIVISVAATGVMALGALTATAAPHVVKYDTTLNGHKERIWFHGDVKSEVGKCESRRRVVLFKVRPGADRKVGVRRSDRSGGWEFTVLNFAPRGGRFYAKVTRELHKDNGFVCLADRSPNHGTLPFCAAVQPCNFSGSGRIRAG